MTQFTKLGVERMKAPPKPQRVDKIHTIHRGLGLALRVSYSGSKTWRALYYVNGKPRTETLGKFPRVSVSEAYNLVCKFDPEAAGKKAKAGTFKEVAESFLATYVSGLERKDGTPLRTKDEIVRCLKKYVYPTWGSLPFLKINRPAVMTLRDDIGKKHGPRQANVVLTILSKLMNWYALRSEDYASPFVRGMKYETKARTRKLTDDEIRTVWKACDGTFGAIVKVLLLTGQRREKVVSMKWDDVVDGVWTIPIEKREKSNAGILNLPKAVVDIINAQPVIAENPYVFAGRRKGSKFNSWSQHKVELDARAPIPAWTLHDLRRTARSLMSRAGVNKDIAEHTLGHTIKGVGGVYDRHDYTEEKARALEALAALVERIMNPPKKGDNVIHMHA